MRIRVSRLGPFAVVLAFLAAGVSLHTQTPGKLDPLVQQRLSTPSGQSRIIVTASTPAALDAIAASLQLAGATVGRRLSLITGLAATVPNTLLAGLAANPAVEHIAYDRAIGRTMERTGATVRATAVRQTLGLDGSGIGVALIDSGVASWHDDLSQPQRVVQFVDFVDGSMTPIDPYGHGTHVAGIVAGSGFDSNGARMGIAPGAHLIALRVLDASGQGRISNVIAALEYVVVHKTEFNIRIANLSIGAGVYESAQVDPLTVAARRAVEAGVVVVAAAGNLGRKPDGTTRAASITAPGNAPWVLTVGASSHMGTIDRSDDTVAAFSSRGPTAIDGNAKPDLVAPGVGIESLSAPGSLFYGTKQQFLLSGTVSTAYLPYLSLTGTSMAAPVVSGTVALMLQANPSLTPNAVKAILQYTSEASPNYDVLTEGAGFLDAQGAVQLVQMFSTNGSEPNSAASWARHLIWGNRYVWGGWLLRDTFAWSPSLSWGDAETPSTSLMTWPTNNVQGGFTGSASGGHEGYVSGTSDEDSVVWGTNGDDEDSLVWGTNCDDDPSCQPYVWRNP
jgi:serine protease AprX